MGEEVPILAKVVQKGRLSIPSIFRKFYGIDEGDFVVIKIVEVRKAKRREEDDSLRPGGTGGGA